MRCFALALTFAAGCSFAFVDGPPKGPMNSRPICTTEKTIPAIDGLIGASNLIALIAVNAAADDVPRESLDSYRLIAIVDLLGAVGYFLGALSGNSDVNHCREAQARWDSGK